MEKVGDLNKRGKRFSCDVDGVGDAGDLRRGIRKYFYRTPQKITPPAKKKRPKFAIFSPAARFYNIFMLLFGHNSAPQANIFVSHIEYFQGGDFLKECDPFTPDTEIECDKKRPDSQKKCDGWGVDGGGWVPKNLNDTLIFKFKAF